MDDYHRNEISAWDDLGPMRPGQTFSPSFANAARRAPTEDEIDAELMGCLVLVVPAGMDRQRRIEWCEVARATVKHLPLDLLRAGCEEARKHADHPAKIVPAILAAAEPLLRLRKSNDQISVPPLQIERRNVEPRGIDAILRESGFGDVADKLAGRTARKAERPAPRMPTADDYRAMGIEIAAQGMEAGTAETAGLGAQHDSPVGTADAPVSHCNHPTPHGEK